MEHIPATPETKSADVAAAFDEFRRGFESYRAENDVRIKAIERKAADPLTDEKVTKIGRALDENQRVLDELVLKSRRPALGRETRALSGAELEHRAAFNAYVRNGEAGGLKLLEGKALAVSTGGGADGGFLVPEETEREIGRRLAQVSPIRAIAGRREVWATSIASRS